MSMQESRSTRDFLFNSTTTLREVNYNHMAQTNYLDYLIFAAYHVS